MTTVEIIHLIIINYIANIALNSTERIRNGVYKKFDKSTKRKTGIICIALA